MRRLVTVGLVAVVGVFGFVACDSDDEESQATAEQNLCAGLDAFASSVLGFQALDPQTASQDDYEAAAQAIQSAWDDVRAEAEDVSEADAAALDSASTELSDAVQDLPEDVPVSEAIAGLQTDVAALSSSWQEISNGAGCGVEAPGATDGTTTS